jgi:cytochrome oxidase assembly protein ShyY1
MKFRFSLPVCIVGTLLTVGFARLSYWQWARHLEKIVLQEEVNTRLSQPPTSLNTLLKNKANTNLPEYTPVEVQGSYDYSNEVVLRNRKHDERPGVLVLTPLKINETDKAILVARGFVPLAYADQESRKQFQRNSSEKILGITKATQVKKIFAPSDAANGMSAERLDAWLRPDIERIQKQIPYDLLPFLVEATKEQSASDLSKALFASSKGKEELLSLSLKSIPSAKEIGDLSQYPIPMVTANLPASRHFGYVFEWVFMGIMTILICLVLQLRRSETVA